MGVATDGGARQDLTGLVDVLDDVRDRLSAMAVTALAYGALLRLEGMGDDALALEVLSQGLYDQADAVGAMSEEIEDGGNPSHVVVREELP